MIAIRVFRQKNVHFFFKVAYQVLNEVGYFLKVVQNDNGPMK